MWEKEKLLATSNFSFSHSVFKSVVLPTCKNNGLFGKWSNTNFRMQMSPGSLEMQQIKPLQKVSIWVSQHGSRSLTLVVLFVGAFKPLCYITRHVCINEMTEKINYLQSVIRYRQEAFARCDKTRNTLKTVDRRFSILF